MEDRRCKSPEHSEGSRLVEVAIAAVASVAARVPGCPLEPIIRSVRRSAHASIESSAPTRQQSTAHLTCQSNV